MIVQPWFVPRSIFVLHRKIRTLNFQLFVDSFDGDGKNKKTECNARDWKHKNISFVQQFKRHENKAIGNLIRFYQTFIFPWKRTDNFHLCVPLNYFDNYGETLGHVAENGLKNKNGDCLCCLFCQIDFRIRSPRLILEFITKYIFN